MQVETVTLWFATTLVTLATAARTTTVSPASQMPSESQEILVSA